MRTKHKPSNAGSAARWFLPGGLVLSVRPDLLPLLKAMDGLTPREILRSRQPEENDGIGGWQPPDLDIDDEQPGVAIVSAIGPLTQYSGPCDWLMGAVSYEQIMADMEAAKDDESAGAILLIVDGPGGMLAGNADAMDRIREISKLKPVVSFSPAECCSASYGIFCSATKSVLSQQAMAGSVGTVWTFIDDSKAQEIDGVREIEFVSEASPDKRPDPTTSEGKALIQRTVNELGAGFVSKVASMRGVSDDTVRNNFGKGWVLIGQAAVDAGLADSVGTLSDAILLAQELAGAASNSTTTGDIPTGATPTTGARATAEHGGAMKTVAELEAESPDTLAQIRSDAAKSERERMSAILKYNTPQYRSFASAQIDAAISNPGITAEMLASQILDLHSSRLAQVGADRLEDSSVIPGVPATPAGTPAPRQQGRTTADDAVEAQFPDPSNVYASFNKQAGWGCNN